MAKAICFQCKGSYQSKNPDDIAGDGRCKECREKAQSIAEKIDTQFRNRPKEQTKSRLQMYDELNARNGGRGVDVRNFM